MKVSIIIPVFNAAPFLDKSIKSALDQKQTGEVLLIDDRSTDKSLEICKRWELLDSRVKVFINDGIKGAGAARNVGLSHAGCDYVAFLDADDYYLEGRFDETEKLFKTYLNIDGVSESVKIVSKDNIELKIIGYKFDLSLVKLNIFLLESPIYITGLTLKIKVLDKIGYFDESLKQTQDSDFMIRVINTCSIYSGTLQMPVSAYVIHDFNATSNEKERNFYRRLFYRKYVFFSLIKLIDFNIFYHFLRRYFFYDYLLLFDNLYINNKILKFFCIPIHFIRLLK